MDTTENRQPRHLAWHETLEIHELVAFQSVGLMKIKNSVGKISDKKLHALYVQTIKDLENNINDLLKFYSLAPRAEVDEDSARLDQGFFAGDLLAFCKTAVRNYAIAITETATPEVRKTLTNHLQKAINCHANVFNYMYANGLYPAYDIQKLLQNDMNLANKALKMGY
ncbi:spore coat protein [Ornithinibacillus sp. L9]|uniref:Spore coat protein n=1 Tax=Ornithinibacillus caprae TaxID=2678566 RepID=A0A6N8FGZ2_9BACI|nr:spore coat protein [Ornithinibacillus caprae]MUK88840.1 spore coat protein [Ornithinibacillus caprae]